MALDALAVAVVAAVATTVVAVVTAMVVVVVQATTMHLETLTNQQHKVFVRVTVRSFSDIKLAIHN